MKDQYAMMAEGAVDMRKLDNGAVLWACEPQPPSPGQTATVFYNSKAGPLSYLNDHTADAPVLNYGFNNWKVAGDKITMSQSSGPRLNTTGVSGTLRAYCKKHHDASHVKFVAAVACTLDYMQL